MLSVLLRARWRHYVNFVRYQFDRRTLLILGVIGLYMAYQAWRSPSDIGISLKALKDPGFGNKWLQWVIRGLPAVYVVFYLLARVSLRRSPDLDLIRCLPLPDSTRTAWLFVRHFSKTGLLLLALVLPALFDSHLTVGVVLRSAAALLVILGVDYLALETARRRQPGQRTGVRKNATFARLPIRGGAVSALMIRDASYLLRSGLHVPLLTAITVILEGIVALAISNVPRALMTAAVVHIIHAVLQMGYLEVLFQRDAATPGLLKSLPIGGSRLWRARALLTASLLALPAFLPAIIGIFRGATPLAWGLFLCGMLVAVLVCGGLLFADVHVALFPRTRVASFLLMAALAAMVLFWFFVPLATPGLAIILLVLWGLKAAGAYDRMEAG